MPSLIDETPDASAWVNQYLAAPAEDNSIGSLVSAVLWTDTYLDDGEPIGGSDPSTLVNEINDRGLPLLRGHDPGLPAGRVIAAHAFRSSRGIRFVAAILAYYEHGHQVSFASLGVDTFPTVMLPSTLESLVSARIEFGIDPREIETLWLKDVLEDSPLLVQRVEFSHNAAESVKELIRVGLPFAALVWNPLVVTVANEAGKDIYAGIRSWLQKLWKKLKELRDPIVDVQVHYHGCNISFLFRGRDIEQHYAAHAALSVAAAQAAKLIENLEQLNHKLSTLTYEFEQSRWFPSYAIMVDGRIVSERSILIAFEQVPKSLSLGLLRSDMHQ